METPELPRRAAAWVAATLGRQATSAGRLKGADSSSLYVMETGGVPAVLRLFTNEEWNRREPDLAAHEAGALEVAAAAGLPVPRPLAHDPGPACGYPAVLMTHLAGRVEVAPSGAGWYREMAERLAAVHAVEGRDLGWEFSPWCDVARVTPPPWARRPGLWERVGEVLAGGAPAGPWHLVHRDYHPANLLWEDGALGGIVDWVNGCRGPSGIDVATMRRNLAHLIGGDAPDRFLTAYLAASGRDYHPYWDLLAAAEVLPGPGIYQPFVTFGADHLTTHGVRERFEALVGEALARLG